MALNMCSRLLKMTHGMTVVTRHVADFESTGVGLLNPWHHAVELRLERPFRLGPRYSCLFTRRNEL
jgi:hypothetical protein